MKNKKLVTLIATLGLLTCMYTKVNAIKFYDTYGTKYEGAVERLGELGIIKGVSDKAFNPERTITRAEFAKMIVEASLTNAEINALIIDDSECNFKDVSKNEWYYKYVVAATNYGFTKGYEDNTFRPNKEVTYEEVSKMLMKALGHTYLVETDPRGWSAEYMEKLYSLNIADDTTKFKKTDKATRGNIAIMLWNTLTNNVWEKIYLNDVAGFTFVDSGRTLFAKKVLGYSYRKDSEIEDFKEIDGRLNVKINGSYYPLLDEDVTISFSMLGGDADGLFRRVRYPQDRYWYEIIGLSTDIDTKLYTGTFDELKEDGFELNLKDIIKIGSNRDYAFYIDSEEENKDRIIELDDNAKSFYVESIKIDEKKEDIEKDDPEVIDEIKSKNYPYLYRENDYILTKKITINESYEIADGAVVFRNNKRVTWNSIKEGEILTEVKKDKYYFVSNDRIDVTIKGYKEIDDKIEFTTSDGVMVAYDKTDCFEYFANKSERKYLYKLDRAKLDEWIDIKARVYIDFTGKIARIEIIERPETEEKESDLAQINVAFFNNYNYTPQAGNHWISLIYDGKSRTYRTKIESVSINYGELVALKFDDSGRITEIKAAGDGAKVNEDFTLKKISYKTITDGINKDKITDNMPIYQAKYYYDFAQYDKIKDYEVVKVPLDELKELEKNKAEYYAIYDDDVIKMILIKDFTEKKDVFYGKIDRIYTEESNTKIQISIFDYTKVTYNLSGIYDCEVGDVISFKLINKDTVKPLEKYTTKVLGYYKDIIVKDIKYSNQIVAENGEINLKDEKIVTKDKEYDLNDYVILLIRVSKNDEGEWQITRGDAYKPSELKLQENDRIAIDEIEDTVIIYRGYKD